jgi:hypothetical protein
MKRAPMRDVVAVFDGRSAGFKYVVELSCGHRVGRHLMRLYSGQYHRGQVGCQACQIAGKSTA